MLLLKDTMQEKNTTVLNPYIKGQTTLQEKKKKNSNNQHQFIDL